MKFKYLLLCIACCLCMISASFVSGEYYHFTDRDGFKHYTDDISEVPKDQRQDLNVYKSIQTPAKTETPKAAPVISSESLEIRKNALDNEYDTLIKNRNDLNREKKEIGEKKYNELAVELNNEIKQYQKKREAYEKLVEQYNKQIQSPVKE